MTPHQALMLSTALGLSLGALAVRAETRPSLLSDTRNVSGTKELWERTHRASKIIGTDVLNRQGEDLGDIKELVLDPGSGDISYAVISFGGVMGMGDKLFAVPWKALKLDTTKNNFVLDVDRERLKSAPAFDVDRWPDMANAQWNNDVHAYYGQRYEGNRIGLTPR
ncbi:MAG TPA: PRC-barrel domain-containing protein [Burkholderiales bacterium]|nr:PRC-barrel domain-containing protein [Burkholderiales bacterium]